MTRRGWRRTIVLTVLTSLATAAITLWLDSFNYTELDNAIRRSGRSSFADVSDIVAKHLPNDFKGAIKALRDFGFVEGDRYVGASYRRLPIPPPSEASEAEREAVRSANQILDEHDAILVKRYSRTIPEIVLDTGVFVYLLKKQNGTFVVYARTTAPVIFL